MSVLQVYLIIWGRLSQPTPFHPKRRVNPHTSWRLVQQDHPAGITVRLNKADANLRYICEPDNVYRNHDAVCVLDARGVSVGVIAAKTPMDVGLRNKLLNMLHSGKEFAAKYFLDALSRLPV